MAMKSLPRTAIHLISFISFMGFFPSIASACIHGPAEVVLPIKENTKQALVFHDGKNAHLIVSTGLECSCTLPEKIAWVIPLPSLPVSYAEESKEIFPYLYRQFEIINHRPSRSFWDWFKPRTKSAPPQQSSIKVHPEKLVGSYKVQPVEILAESDGSELNTWLKQNGFGTVSREGQAYYLKKGAVFLALKLEGLNGSKIGVKPLHIVYPSDYLSLPLKFSSHSGTFDVHLYLVTDERVPKDLFEANGLTDRVTREKLENDRWRFLVTLTGKEKGYLTQFVGEKINAAGRRVTDMETDPLYRVLPDS